MTKSEKQWWEQERAKGYNRYLLHAIVRSGLRAGIGMTLVYILLPFIGLQILPIREFLCLLGILTLYLGWSTGSQMWRDNEKHYEEPTEDDQSAA